MVSKIFRESRQAERIHAASCQRTNLFDRISSETNTNIQILKYGNRSITVHYEDTQTSNNIQLPAKAGNGVRKSKPVEDAEFDHESQWSRTLNLPESYDVYL
jgi:hypothetical protein